MNARLQLRLIKRAKSKPGTWGRLAAPVDADETMTRIRAQSLLCGIQYRDGSTQAPPLTLSQAQDVLRWTNTHMPAKAG